MSGIEIREFGLAEHAQWRALISDSPDGSIYSYPDYLAALCEATGATFRILGAFREDRLEGGVALYECQGAGGGFVAPRLLLYYSGPVLARQNSNYPSERTSRHVQALAALAGSFVLEVPRTARFTAISAAQGMARRVSALAGRIGCLLKKGPPR